MTDRITIRHKNGNTITGTPEQVLNYGHLKDGWKWIPETLPPERIAPLTTGDDRIVPLTAGTPLSDHVRKTYLLDPEPWVFAYVMEKNQEYRSAVNLNNAYIFWPRPGYSQNREDYA